MEPVQISSLKRPEGVFEIRRGIELAPNEAVLVVEDVSTTGGSVLKVVELLRQLKAGPVTDGRLAYVVQAGKDGADLKAYDPKSGNFPETVTRNDILASQVYSIGGTQRKGGFMATADMELDEKAVQKTRDQQ